MRTRNSLTAMLCLLVAILAGVIVTLVGCSAPHASAERPEPAPATADSPAPPRTSGGGGAAVPGKPRAPVRPSSTPATKSPSKTSPKPAVAKPIATPAAPKLGTATALPGTTYNRADDGRTFTMVFSTLDVSTDADSVSKSMSTTIAVIGDTDHAALVLAASGAATTEGATAKITISANGRTATQVFKDGADNDYVQSITVPLHGTTQCYITLKIEINPNPDVREPAGAMDVLALDGRFR